VTSPGAVGLDGYGFELTRFRAAGYEVEPNNDDATANALDGGKRAAGVIDAVNDVDVFSFTATANRVTGIAIYAGTSGSDGDFNFSGHGSSMEPLLTIRDSMGVVVAEARPDPLTVFAQSVTNPLPSMQLAFLPETSGTYYVEVADEVANFGSDVYYVIEQF